MDGQLLGGRESLRNSLGLVSLFLRQKLTELRQKKPHRREHLDRISRNLGKISMREASFSFFRNSPFSCKENRGSCKQNPLRYCDKNFGEENGERVSVVE